MPNSPIIAQAAETMEGDNVIVKRLFPIAGLRNHDPFVLWDHFEITPGSGFPAHPHRGFEAITFLFSGSMEHDDNLGNSSSIGPGGAQRFTAGKGIVHSEMPAGDEPAHGIQLWINLPKRLKHIEPAYQEASSDEIITREIQDEQGHKVTIRCIVGKDGPIQLQTPVEYYELYMETGSTYQWTPPNEYSGLVYIINGVASINDKLLNAGEALLFEQNTGMINPLLFLCQESCQLMVCFGRPHGEPILQRGTSVD